jgi:hypothetical protein
MTPVLVLVTTSPSVPLIPALSNRLSGMSILPMVPELFTVTGPLIALIPKTSPTPPIEAVVIVPKLLMVFALCIPVEVPITEAPDYTVMVLLLLASMPVAPKADTPFTEAPDTTVRFNPFCVPLP